MTDDPKNPKSKSGVAETPAPYRTKGRTLKVRRIGNSLGVVLPKEVLAKLKVGEGDELSVTDTPNGVTLSPFDEALQEQIEAGRRGMRRYRNALRELSK